MSNIWQVIEENVTTCELSLNYHLEVSSASPESGTLVERNVLGRSTKGSVNCSVGRTVDSYR